MNFPLVSIVITSYNRENWIGQAIESALAQDYPNLEIIISDNCSTDNSDEVIKKYCSDSRVRYTRNETNIGMIPNFNKGFFELAKGEYITNLSSDDYFTNPTFITKALRVINKYENISVVFGIHNSLDEISKNVLPTSLPGEYDIEFKKGEELFIDFDNKPCFSAGGALYSASHLRDSGIKFSERATADLEMNFRMMLCGNVGFINGVVYMTRLHASNASGQFNNVEAIYDMYLDVYDAVYSKAKTIIKDEGLLKKWYNNSILRNLEICWYSVSAKKSRKLTRSFNKLAFKKYRKLYLFLLFRKPKLIVRMILNI